MPKAYDIPAWTSDTVKAQWLRSRLRGAVCFNFRHSTAVLALARLMLGMLPLGGLELEVLRGSKGRRVGLEAETTINPGG